MVILLSFNLFNTIFYVFLIESFMTKNGFYVYFISFFTKKSHVMEN